jgi:hypothetical protein
MIPHQFYYQLVVLGLLWLFIMLHYAWPSRCAATQPHPAKSITPQRKRSNEPQPFTGLIHPPLCDACAHATALHPASPSSPPPVLTFTRGRKRRIDTQNHFCPDADCAYYGWTGRGNLRANGHPDGKPWRQFQTPSDLVVKFQPVDIVGFILCLVLQPRVVYQREIKG